jgi:hypothetical protein
LNEAAGEVLPPLTRTVCKTVLRDAKSGRCVPTAKKDTHRPGLAPALGLRAGNGGVFIVPQTNL